MMFEINSCSSPESSNVTPLNSSNLDSNSNTNSSTPDSNPTSFLSESDDLAKNLNSLQPNNPSYYSSNLSKDQFNKILINSTLLITKIFYPEYSHVKLTFFIKEILKRSKTSIQTLQLSLYYIIKLSKSHKINDDASFKCPKKLLLTSIISASKFINDKNYSFKSWSKISGLPTDELVCLEKVLLKSLNYELYLSKKNYEIWCDLLIIIGFDLIFNEKALTATTLFNFDLDNLNFDQTKLIKWKYFLINFNFDKNSSIIENCFTKCQNNLQRIFNQNNTTKIFQNNNIDSTKMNINDNNGNSNNSISNNDDDFNTKKRCFNEGDNSILNVKKIKV